MPKPFSDVLGSMKLPARDPMSQLPARLAFGLAELPEDLVRWVCVALAHRVLHLCEHVCKIMVVISKCRLVGCSAGDHKRLYSALA